MTELETMQRAKMYMDKLAQGIDPISDVELPQDTVLNNVRMARCFFYVSGVLEQVIRNGGVVGARVGTVDFSLTAAQRSQVQLFQEPVRITEFADALHRAAGNPDMKKPNAGKITEWLEKNGLMYKQLNAEGKYNRLPTDSGRKLGMQTIERQSPSGAYTAVLYDRNAQRFLLDHLDEILAGGNADTKC